GATLDVLVGVVERVAEVTADLALELLEGAFRLVTGAFTAQITIGHVLLLVRFERRGPPPRGVEGARRMPEVLRVRRDQRLPAVCHCSETVAFACDLLRGASQSLAQG